METRLHATPVTAECGRLAVRFDGMSPEELVGLAIDTAETGLMAGELPIGAVVVHGDEVVGRAHTQENALGRRLVHADLLAMEQADQALGWRERSAPLRLAVNLEPCLMCLGTAMVLGVAEIYYGLDSPSDGAADLPEVWAPASPDMPFSRIPKLTGGIHRSRVRDQFASYAEHATVPELRRWASSLADPTT